MERQAVEAIVYREFDVGVRDGFLFNNSLCVRFAGVAVFPSAFFGRIKVSSNRLPDAAHAYQYITAGKATRITL